MGDPQSDMLSEEDREDARALGVGWAEEEVRVHDHLFGSIVLRDPSTSGARR